METQKKTRLKLAVISLSVSAIIIVLTWFDFHVWRLKHPQAPTWTFFFGE